VRIPPRFSIVVDMRVTFTRTGERRYSVAIERAVGPRLAARQGPGYDPYLPHDLVHFVAEAEAGLRGAVFGSLAAGESGIFWPEDATRIRGDRRRARKRTAPPAAQADMLLSERLAALSLSVWQLRTGRRSEPPAWFAQLTPEQLGAPLIDRICDRLDRVAPRWHALPVGGGITLTWPFPEGHGHSAPPRRRPDSTPRNRKWATGAAARRG
jgi:hypothetical protein